MSLVSLVSLATPPTDRRLFVYYRVPETALAATVSAVRTMQAALAEAHPGLCAELLRRPELRDGEVTLMETYAATAGRSSGTPDVLPAGISDALADALNRAAVDLPQPRHLEWFEPLA